MIIIRNKELAKTLFEVSRNKRKFIFSGYDTINSSPEITYRGTTGTLSAVYYFLNKYVGITFFFPGKNGYQFTKNR